MKNKLIKRRILVILVAVCVALVTTAVVASAETTSTSSQNSPSEILNTQEVNNNILSWVYKGTGWYDQFLTKWGKEGKLDYINISAATLREKMINIVGKNYENVDLYLVYNKISGSDNIDVPAGEFDIKYISSYSGKYIKIPNYSTIDTLVVKPYKNYTVSISGQSASVTISSDAAGTNSVAPNDPTSFSNGGTFKKYTDDTATYYIKPETIKKYLPTVKVGDSTLSENDNVYATNVNGNISVTYVKNEEIAIKTSYTGSGTVSISDQIKTVKPNEGFTANITPDTGYYLKSAQIEAKGENGETLAENCIPVSINDPLGTTSCSATAVSGVDTYTVKAEFAKVVIKTKSGTITPSEAESARNNDFEAVYNALIDGEVVPSQAKAKISFEYDAIAGDLASDHRTLDFDESGLVYHKFGTIETESMRIFYEGNKIDDSKTITIAKRQASIELNTNAIEYTYEVSWREIFEAVFSKVTANSGSTTIEEEYTADTLKLQEKKNDTYEDVTLTDWPAEGSHTIRVCYEGSTDYVEDTKDLTINVKRNPAYNIIKIENNANGTITAMKDGVVTNGTKKDETFNVSIVPNDFYYVESAKITVKYFDQNRNEEEKTISVGNALNGVSDYKVIAEAGVDTYTISAVIKRITVDIKTTILPSQAAAIRKGGNVTAREQLVSNKTPAIVDLNDISFKYQIATSSEDDFKNSENKLIKNNVMQPLDSNMSALDSICEVIEKAINVVDKDFKIEAHSFGSKSTEIVDIYYKDKCLDTKTITIEKLDTELILKDNYNTNYIYENSWKDVLEGLFGQVTADGTKVIGAEENVTILQRAKGSEDKLQPVEDLNDWPSRGEYEIMLHYKGGTDYNECDLENTVFITVAKNPNYSDVEIGDHENGNITPSANKEGTKVGNSFTLTFTPNKNYYFESATIKAIKESDDGDSEITEKSKNITSQEIENPLGSTEYVVTTESGVDKYIVSAKFSKISIKTKDGTILPSEAEAVRNGTSGAQDAVYEALIDGATEPPEAGENISFQYLAYSAEIFGQDIEVWKPLNFDPSKVGEIVGYHAFCDNDEEKETVRILYNGEENDVVVDTTTRTIKVDRIQTTLLLKQDAEESYVYETTWRDILGDIFDKVVIAEGEDKAGDTVTANPEDVYLKCDGEKLSLDAIPDVGTYDVTVQYDNQGDYAASSADKEITITQATGTMTVKVEPANVTYEDEYTISVDTNAKAYATIIAGVDSEVKGFISLSLKFKENSKSQAVKLVYDMIKNKIGDDGIELGEFELYLKKLMESELVQKAVGEDIMQLLDLLGVIPDVEADAVIYLDKNPEDAGAYLVAAGTTDRNYTFAADVGYLTIAPKTANVALKFNQEIPESIYYDKVDQYTDYGAKLYDGDKDVTSKHVQYLILGITEDGLPFSSTDPADYPTKPGKYVETVSVILGNYLAVPIARNIDIIKYPVEIKTDEDIEVTYDGEKHGATGAVYDGLNNETKIKDLKPVYVGLESTAPYYSEEAPTDAGIYQALFTYEGTEHYQHEETVVNIRINKRDASTVTIGDITTTYNQPLTYDQVKANSTNVDNGMLEDEYEEVLNTVACIGVNHPVGEHKMAAYAPLDILKNYKGIQIDKGLHKVEPATITDNDVTLDEGPFVYNGEEIRPDATVKAGDLPLLRGKEKDFIITYEDNTDAGDAKAIIKGVNNYTGEVTKTFEIKKAESKLEAEDNVKGREDAKETFIYNGEDQQLMDAVAAEGGTTVYSLDGETFSEDLPAAKDAGDYTVSYKVQGDKNHNDSEVRTRKVTIEKKPITVTAKDTQSYVYSDLAELEYDSDELCEGDSFEGELATDANKNKIGTYKITQGTLTAGDNYEITFVEGVYSVKMIPATKTPYKVKMSGDKGNVEISGTLTGQEFSLKSISDESLSEINEKDNVEIDLTSIGKEVNAIRINKETLERISETGAAGLKINLSTAEAVIDQTALKAVCEQATDTVVHLVIYKDQKAESTMNDTQENAVNDLKNPTVLDASFVSGGKKITNFKGGTVKVITKYSGAKAVQASYIAENGEEEILESAYTGEEAGFPAEHFSHYVISDISSSFNDSKLIATAKAVKGGISYSWNKVKGASKYKVYQCINGKKAKCIKTTKSASFTKKNLKKAYTYKGYVVAFNKSGKKIATSPAAYNGIRGSKKQLVQSVTSIASLTLKEGSKTSVAAESGSKLRYYTADKKIATVDAKGNVTGVGTGNVCIYSVTDSGVHAVTRVQIIK